MADREQLWKIVADFGSLTRNARNAAKAVEELDAARRKAGDSSKIPMVRSDEADSLDKLSIALIDNVKYQREATDARRKHNEAMNGSRNTNKNAARETQTLTDALSRQSTVLKNGIGYHEASTTATDNHARSMHEFAGGADAAKDSLGHLNAESRQNASIMSSNNKAVKASTGGHRALRHSITDATARTTQLGASTSFLTKAFADIIPVSRSWALFMKMLPLTAVTSAVNTLLPAVGSLTAGMVGLVGTIGPLVGLLGALPTMAFAAAGAFGGLISGMSGIFGAMGKYKAMNEAITKSEQKSTASTKKADAARQKTINSTIKQIAKAEKDKVRAARAVRDAEREVVETARSNARNIASSERSLADAQKDAKRAQQDITDARKEAADALEDYRLKLKGAALDEEGAVLSLQEARARLAEVIIDPGSSALEEKNAKLAVRQAELRIEEVRDSNAQLEKDAADAQKRGIEGSSGVVDAKAQEADATVKVSDAIEDLKDTNYDAAKATESSARAVEDSIDSYAEAGDRIADLRDALAEAKEAIDDTTDATKPGEAQINAYNDALAALPPSAQAVVHQLEKIQEAWKQVSYRSQAALSPGLLSFLNVLHDTLLPRIADFLERMALGAGAWFDALGQVLSRDRNLRNLNDIFEDSFDLMTNLGAATLNVIEWFLGLGAAAKRSGLTKWIGDVIESWTRGWADSVGSEDAIDATADSFKNSMEWAERWGDAIKGVWRLLRTYMKAFRPLGGRLLSSLTDLTNKWADWVESPSGKSKISEWDKLADINLSGLSDMLGTITDRLFGVSDSADETRDKLKTFWTTLNGEGGRAGGGFINKLADLLGLVDETMITNILGLGEGIMDVLIALGQGGGIAVVEGIVSAFSELADIASTLFKVIPGLAPLLVGMMGIFSSKKILVAMGALTGATPFFKAVETATTKGYTGSNLARASMGEFMGFGNFQKGKQLGPWKDDTIRGGTIPAGYYPQPSKTPIPAGYYPQPSKTPIPAGYYPQPASTPLPAPKPAPYVPLTRKETSITRKTANTRLSGSYAADQKIFEAQAKLNLDAINKQTVATSRYRSAVGKVGAAVGKVGTAWGKVSGLMKGAASAILIGIAISKLYELSDAVGGVAASAEEVSISLAKVSSALDAGDTDKMAKSFDDLFSRAKGGIVDLDTAANAITNKNFFADFFKWGRFDGIREAKKSLAELDTQLAAADYKTASTSFDILRKSFEDAGMPIEDIINLLPEYRDSIRLASVENTGAELSGEALADAMSGTSDEFNKGKEAADKEAGAVEASATAHEAAAEATEKNKKALEDTISKYDETTDAVNALTDAQDKQQGKFISAIQAKDNYNTAQEAFIAGLKESKTGVEGDTAANRSNRDAMFEVATSARDAAKALLENGEGADAANASMDDARKTFIDAHDQMGLTAQEAADLADDLNLIPNYTELNVVMTNGKLTQDQIDGLQASMLLFDEETKLKVNTTAIEEGGTAAEALVEYITNANPNLKIGVTIDDSPSPATSAWGKYNAANKKSSPRPLNPDIWKHRATGGPVFGAGTSTSDSIPALLSDGEYVIKARSAKRIGYSNLDRANHTGNITRKYANGGRVQKFASGGKASGSGVMAGLTIQLTGLSDLASATGNAIAGWGNKFAGGWAGLWSKIVGVTKISTLQVGNLLGTPWARTWTTARSTAMTALGGVVSGTVTMSGAMGIAMNKFMTAMKNPIKAGLDFINGTLGAAVNSIGSFYGVKEKSPFPIQTPGFSEGGWTGAGSKYQEAGVVHADEYVINKNSRRNIERKNPGVLDYMNRKGSMPGYADGGRVKPVVSNTSGNTYSGHSGLDFPAAAGTPVRAAAAGTIISTPKLNRSYGWHVVERLSDGLRAVYAHLSRISVSPGQSVAAGQELGAVGNTGNSNGNHLHFEIADGSTGSPSNVALTRKWLAGAQDLGSAADTNLDPSVLSGAMSGITGGLAKFMSSMGADSPWAEMVGASVFNLTKQTLSKITSAVGAIAASSGSNITGNFDDGDQRSNAFGIAEIAFKRGMGHRGALLGIMAAMQESSLKNLRGGDRDSLGLFQQRPSQGWGTAAQIMNPSYAANKFFDSLMGKSWETGPEWEDIQSVQVSAHPTAYQKHKSQALRYLADYMATKNGGFSEGGWTGRGSKYKPAGVVHADEYVINKESRRRIERTHPGVLDHLNQTGSMPGYASGGYVGNASKFTMPRTLKGFTPYFSYLQEAEGKLWSRPAETIKHIQIVENLMAHEGLLSRERANGMWDKYDTAAWKSWQKISKQPDNGYLDNISMTALMKKYGVHYNAITPFVPGMTQPSRTDAVQGGLDTSNAKMAEYMGYLNKLRGLGFSSVFDSLKQIGPTGIPDEYKDTPNPLTGMEMAKSFSGNIAAARRYEEALKKASELDGTSTTLLEKKLSEMLDLITYGVDGPLGLQTAARSLGVSVDTAAMLFNKLSSRGSFKNVAGSRTSRLRGDVADFGNLFKFSKGGIVPGFGNTDSVHALLTPGELVVPKNIVNNMFSPAPSVTPFLNLSTRSANRTDTNDGDAGNTYQFITTVNNPVAEESSVSVQRRVKSAASLGLLGGRK